MFRYTVARFGRRPGFMLAMVLFAAVLTAALCLINRNIEDEIAAYEETYRTIPVKVQMCDLTGYEVDDLNGAAYVMNVFRSEYEMGKYLKDVELKVAHKNASLTIDGQETRLGALYGITSLDIDANFAQQPDNAVAWAEGYDESILKTDERVCIVPETMVSGLDIQAMAVKLNVIEVHTDIWTYYYEKDFIYDMKIAGTYKGDGEVYVPFDFLTDALRRHDNFSIIKITAASATAADNYFLDELKEEAYDWFAVPNDTGEETLWENGPYYFETYPTALKIDDSRLAAASAAMENSIKINTMCAYIVLGISAVAGFFAGFLAIRSRKREISLMRTLGNSALSIFAGFGLEQLICLVLGVFIGGAAFMWRPAEQVGLFMGIYFLGIAAALAVFISKNLLHGQNEDE